LTGEEFATDHCMQQAPVVRALVSAVETMQRELSVRERRRSTPENSGKPWSPEDESLLEKSFEEGTSIGSLAALLKRSRASVYARLVKLGKVEPDPDMELALLSARKRDSQEIRHST
jgi:hypothetical protein